MSSGYEVRQLCSCILLTVDSEEHRDQFLQKDTGHGKQNTKNTLVAHAPSTRDPTEENNSAGLNVTGHCGADRSSTSNDEDLQDINQDSTDCALDHILAIS